MPSGKWQTCTFLEKKNDRKIRLFSTFYIKTYFYDFRMPKQLSLKFVMSKLLLGRRIYMEVIIIYVAEMAG